MDQSLARGQRVLTRCFKPMLTCGPTSEARQKRESSSPTYNRAERPHRRATARALSCAPAGATASAWQIDSDDATIIRVLVSIIFGIILLAYIAVRWASWVRGQIRLRLIHRHALPAPVEALAAPAHLHGPLHDYFVACERLRVELAHQRRIVAEVLLSDPDTTFGQVRDARYRRAILEADHAIATWHAVLADLELNHPSAASTRARAITELNDIVPILAPLEKHSRVARHSRALEPFPEPEVRLVSLLFGHVITRLRTIQDAILELNDTSYRGDARGLSA